MSRLLESGEAPRKEALSRNIFNKEDKYEVGNSRALSDGDVHGKGLNNGQVGSSDDIAARTAALMKNRYGKNNPYNIENA